MGLFLQIIFHINEIFSFINVCNLKNRDNNQIELNIICKRTLHILFLHYFRWFVGE